MLISLIKQLLPITEALEEYTEADLSRVNTNRERFNIRCPFHDDKHPSFTVYTDSNRWKCWAGCGQGDVIDLVAESQGIPLRQAVKLLAEHTGLHKGPQKKKVAKLANKQLSDKQTIAEYKQILQNVFNILLTIERKTDQLMAKVRTIEEAGKLAELYHSKSYITYLLDCITHGELEEQIQAVYTAEQWLNNLERRKGNEPSKVG